MVLNLPEAVVVIPTFNEVDTVEMLVNKILASYKKIKVLFVDDSSSDGTSALLDLLASRHKKKIFVIHRGSNDRGLGKAYVTGFFYALKKFKANIFISMDADLSHNPLILPNLIDKIREADMVLGSRYIAGGKVSFDLKRKFMSKGANLLATKTLGLSFQDVTSSYRAYSRQALTFILKNNIKSSGYSFPLESLFIAYKGGFKIVEIPIFFKDRASGKSKLGKKEIPKFFLTVLRLRLSQRKP